MVHKMEQHQFRSNSTENKKNMSNRRSKSITEGNVKIRNAVVVWVILHSSKRICWSNSSRSN